MVALPVLSLQDGLHTSPSEAGPDHCVVGSKNFHSEDGRLKSRLGFRNVLNVPGVGEIPYVAWTLGTSEPTTVYTGSSPVAGTTQGTLYIGASAPFRRASIWGTSQSELGIRTDGIGIGTPPERALGVFTTEVWDGSAWVAAPCVQTSPNECAHAASGLNAIIKPFNNYNASAAGLNWSGVQADLILDAPSTWSAKTINSHTLYWARIRSTAWSGVYKAVVPSACFVQSTYNRILHINVFRDRRGTQHTFVAFLYGTDGKNLRFLFDGVQQAQSVGMTPDGRAVVFGPDTRVESVYHQATDRLIGHVSGLGWFYLCAAGIDVAGAGTVYSLRADPYGTDTAYATAPGGLRSAIPDCDRLLLFDGRMFATSGQSVVWSAPGVYADIWPNQNEALLGDSNGNIVGMAQAGGMLVLLKRNAIWVGQSDGSADGYTFYPMPGNVGAVGGICSVGNTVLFLAEDGIYSFDGAQNAQKLSGNICGLIDSPEFSSNSSHAVAAYHSPSNSYRMYYPGTSAGGGTLNRALYADLTHEGGPSWWPQELGLPITTVCQDNTTDKNRILVGDAWGSVWESDVGSVCTDGPTAYTCRVISHRIGLGSSQRAIVRWVNPAALNHGALAWTADLWNEGREDRSQTVSFWAQAATDEQVFTSRMLDGVRAFPYEAQEVMHQGSVACDARWFQIALNESAGYQLIVDHVEVEVNPVGRRGAP